MHVRKRQVWRAAMAAATAIIASAALAGPAAAAPDKPDPPPWTPPAESAPNAEACTFTAGEFTHCLRTELWMNKAPGVDRKATLRIRLHASADLPDVKVTVRLPATLAWERPPKDFTTARATSAAPEAAGAVDSATLTVDMRKGNPRTWTAQVRGVKQGSALVRTEATTARGEPFDSAPEVQALTVGDSDKTSYLGYGKAPHQTTEVPAGVTVERSAPRAGPQAGPSDGLAKPDGYDEGVTVQQAESCVAGRWTYTTANGTFGVPNFRVEVWDQDNFDIDDLLARGTTDADGRFRLCFDNHGDGDDNGQDVYVQYFADNESWTVENADEDMWIWEAVGPRDIADGETVDFGTRSPADANQHRALRIFDTANTAAAWTPGRCWDRDDGDDCWQLAIEWPTDDGGAHYDSGDHRVHIPDAVADNDFTVSHEIGHGVMNDLYNDGMPSSEEGCSQHFLWREEGPICSWKEGWAGWYGMKTTGDTSPAGRPDLENHTWGSRHAGENWDNGENVEGRIAGAMWDLEDGNNEDYWDERSESLGNIWDVMTAHRPESFSQFWEFRGEMGQDRGDDVRSTLYQNTIDEAFNNPLTSDIPETYRSPQPPGQHDYKMTTEPRFWSALAVRPPAGSNDYDLRLFPLPIRLAPAEQSRAAGDTVDFVAIDSNIDGEVPRPWFPRVDHYSGDGEYQIEFADEADLLVPGDTTRVMGSNDVVEVFDLCTSDRTRITVTPSGQAQDPELHLVQSSGGDSLIPRSGTLRSSIGGAAGEAESIDFTPSGLDCFGVVLINSTAQAGTYTINSSAL